MSRKYLSKGEVLEVQAVLNQFVGLTLTDVWYMYGRIFEFGEQKHFINHSGEDSYQAHLSVKAMNGFRVRGFNETDLTEKNFADPDRNWTDLAMEFRHLWEKNELVVQSIVVGRDGSIAIELLGGVSIFIHGRTWTREFEIWHLVCDDRSFLYDSKGLFGGVKDRGPKIAASDLEVIKVEIEKLTGLKATQLNDDSEVHIELLGDPGECRVTVSSLRAIRFRRADRIVHRDSAELSELWDGSRVVDFVRIDDRGTLAIWLGEWVMVFRADAPHSWRIQHGDGEIICDVDGFRVIAC